MFTGSAPACAAGAHAGGQRRLAAQHVL